MRIQSLTLPILIAAVPTAHGQCLQDKLTATGGQADDWFGWAIAMSEDTMIVGAHNNQLATASFLPESGAGYIFERTGSGWVPTAVLQGSLQESDDSFGHAVDVDGDTAVVGAVNHIGGGAPTGAVFVFERAGTSWVESAVLEASDPSASQFGFVAVSGDTIIAGSGGEGATSASGTAYVFERQASGWVETQEIFADDGADADLFGARVSLAGDVAVIGARGDDDNGGFSGSAYVFERRAAGWMQTAKLLPGDGGGSHLFGLSVHTDGERIVVGAPQHNSSTGAAYLFENRPSGWHQAKRLVPPDGGGSGDFGRSVTIDLGTIVVGAYEDSQASLEAGAVYVFDELAGDWTLRTKVIPTDASLEGQFGQAVAFQRTTMVVGAIKDDTLGQDAGAIYVYGLDPVVGAPYCFGDGSGTACPCGNESDAGAGQGCANSTGQGAELFATGTGSLARDDLTFHGRFLPPAQPALVFVGTDVQNGGAGNPFGDGLRCVGGQIVRLQVRLADAYGQADWCESLQSIGGWTGASTRYFDVWYRDPVGGPCGSGFNKANALEVVFTP